MHTSHLQAKLSVTESALQADSMVTAAVRLSQPNWCFCFGIR